MDKTAIKNFAVWARVKLMEDIRTRLGLLGITEDGISDPLPASTNEVKYFDIGADHPVSIKGEAIRQRKQMAEEIRKAGEKSNYQSAYRNFIESSAYVWFDRLVAIRYMEVNEYAPLDVRLLSSVEPGKQDPDLLSTPFDGSLEYSESETQQILAWKEQHDNNKLFRFLLFKMCNQLNEVLPGIFEARGDASELLMRQSFIDKDGIIHHLVNDIPEEDWKDQVQIIGWIYQYYNSELKAEVFAKKEKVTKDELPAVTQLFTPDWIVRYMVENSLGRLWIEHLRGLNPDVDEKETAEKFGWKYYLPEAKQEPEVEQQLAKIREEYAALKPEDLSCLDPCMGSGHILVYMFDVLEQIYASVGYSEREAAKAILENNIYGLDIDDRAYQLAYFAVMMKARQYNRRILTSGIKAHVYSIRESNGITKNQLQEMGENLSPEEKTKALSQVVKLAELFHDAKEYGSILNIPEMDWNLLRRFATPEEKMGQASLNWNQEASERLMQLIDQGEVMAKKYWVTCTNPPYMGAGGMNSRLSSYLHDRYNDYKADMFSTMIVKCTNTTKRNGFTAFIAPQSFMFLGSQGKLRKYLIDNCALINLLDLGIKAFDSGFGTATAVLGSKWPSATIASCIDLTDTCDKENAIPSETEKNIFKCSTDTFNLLPQNIFSYSTTTNYKRWFENTEKIKDYFTLDCGIKTGKNSEFVRTWQEVSANKIDLHDSSLNDMKSGTYKWFKYSHGGGFQKWYGTFAEVINMQFDAKDIKEKVPKATYRLRDENKYFLAGMVWPMVGTNKFSCKYLPFDVLPDIASNVVYCDAEYQWELLAYMNSVVFNEFMKRVNPTVNYPIESVGEIPYRRLNDSQKDYVIQRCIENVKRCKWYSDNNECSWDFETHPLITKNELLKIACNKWEEECNRQRSALKRCEEEINELYIENYELQDEIKPDINDNELMICVVKAESEIRSLISYAIGCIFGRYSLDKEGLIYAGGDWKAVQSVYKSFLPDRDNVIPITDQKYLDDDVVERICEFLTVVYGADTLEENLDFIAKALGNKGLTSREVIRNYMLNNFFKDHCKTYSVTGSGKRPIYWLFDSGKENAFKALVYMHRWDADTTGRVLLYAQQIQQKYETEIRAIDMMLDHITDARQKSTEEKRQEHLKKQLEELVNYEERLEHMANERIAIDLDDGVKVNYEKVQTDRNGKKYQILAPIK